MTEHKQVDQLRRELADALCVAQGLPVPRTGLHKMLYSLLTTAFAGLDDGSGIDRAQACTIAMHALREWRRMSDPGEQAVRVAAPV